MGLQGCSGARIQGPFVSQVHADVPSSCPKAVNTDGLRSTCSSSAKEMLSKLQQLFVGSFDFTLSATFQRVDGCLAR